MNISQNLLCLACIAYFAVTPFHAAYAQGEPAAIPNFLTSQPQAIPQQPNDAALPPPAPMPSSDTEFFGLEEGFDFEKSPEELENEVRSEAFEAALQGLLPLRPEEIRILLERFDRTQEAVEVPIYPDPKPEFIVNSIPMDPGSQPLKIKTALGHVTTLSFIDATGQPWPIQRITWAGDFDVIETSAGEQEDSYENVLRIMPRSDYAKGNISIDMLELKTPIIMILDTSRDTVHYRYDAIVPDRGPFAKAPIIQKGITIAAGGKSISSILQGIIPSEAQKLNVSGTDGRTSAYKHNGLTYLRTPLTLLSPGWSNSVSSADGMHTYEIQETPVVLLSDRGQMVRANISEREALINE